MNNTGIEWCDVTWNPVSGCLHDCPYCYARAFSKRLSTQTAKPDGGIHDLKKRGETIYPFGFDPTFHRYRLEEPQKVKAPQTVFVGSMCDLFGEWVPDEWIADVFKACEAAPQHRYLFLTKNPARYLELAQKGELPANKNRWYGTTAPTDESQMFWSQPHNTFTSIEPILGAFECGEGLGNKTSWVIIGAESGTRKDKTIPQREWIEAIVDDCRKRSVPVFLKNSLAKIWGEPLIQEFPWEVSANG